MAMASVKATPRIMLVRMVPETSGLRPIAWRGPSVSRPIPIPGPMAPRPIASPAPSARAASRSILSILLHDGGARVQAASVSSRRFRMGPGFIAVPDRRHVDEEHGQQGGGGELNQPDEELQPVESGRQEEWDQIGHYEDQHGPGEDIAEETEGKRDHPAELGDNLQQAGTEFDDPDGPASEGREIEEFQEIAAALTANAISLDDRHRDEGQGQGEVEIGGDPPDQGRDIARGAQRSLAGLSRLGVVAPPLGRLTRHGLGAVDGVERERAQADLTWRVSRDRGAVGSFQNADALGPGEKLEPVADEDEEEEGGDKREDRGGSATRHAPRDGGQHLAEGLDEVADEALGRGQLAAGGGGPAPPGGLDEVADEALGRRPLAAAGVTQPRGREQLLQRAHHQRRQEGVG